MHATHAAFVAAWVGGAVVGCRAEHRDADAAAPSSASTSAPVASPSGTNPCGGPRVVIVFRPRDGESVSELNDRAARAVERAGARPSLIEPSPAIATARVSLADTTGIDSLLVRLRRTDGVASAERDACVRPQR